MIPNLHRLGPPTLPGSGLILRRGPDNCLTGIGHEVTVEFVSERELQAEFEQLARSDPSTALARLPTFLRAQDTSGQPGKVKILRDAALAARAILDLDMSEDLLGQASTEAVDIGDDEGQTWVQITRSYNLFLLGRAEEAISLLEGLDPMGDAHLETVIKFQQATIFGRLGRASEAVALLNEAEQVGFDADGGFHQTQVLKNRGMFLARLGDYESARADLLESQRLARELGLDWEVAFCEHNLGLAASLIGDLPTAFRLFENAEHSIRQLSGRDFESKVGHCRALMAAGLFGEAAVMAGAAADECDDAGFLVDAAETRLLQASALVASGQLVTAAQQADVAAHAFSQQGLDGWAAAAEIVGLVARHRQGELVDPGSVEARIAQLEGSALRADAIEANLFLLELTTRVAPEDALDSLELLEAESTTWPARLRLAAATTEALIRNELGDRTGVLDVAEQAFDAHLKELSLLGAADLRAGFRRHATQLGELGLRAALAEGDPKRLLAWQDRIGLSANTPPPIRPPADPKLRRTLAQLRALDVDSDNRRRDLEESVRLLHRGRGTEFAGVAREGRDGAPSIPGTAVIFSAIDGRLVASRVDTPDARYADLGEIDDILRFARSVRADLRRRALHPGWARPTRIVAGFRRLEDRLFGDLPRADGALIISAVPELFFIPWCSLPSRIGRSTSVVTSLSAWGSTPVPTTASDVALATGPDLEHADAEVEALVERFMAGPARLRRLDRCDVSSALRALARADLAHIVAHGTVRTDNPLFSSLRMADGELSVYELGDLEKVPSVVVLSACHVGLPADAPGQELLGMVTGFLNAGTSCVIASTLPVPDAQSTIDIMTRLHRFLADGMSPATAWAEVQRTCETEDQLLDTAAFTVFGRG